MKLKQEYKINDVLLHGTLPNPVIDWMSERIRSNTPDEEIIEEMKLASWDESLCRFTLKGVKRRIMPRKSSIDPNSPNLKLTAHMHQEALSGKPNPLTSKYEVLTKPMPKVDLSGNPSTIDVDGHIIEVTMSLNHPRVITFSNFLTDEECDALIAGARPKLTRSSVVDDATGASKTDEVRTSTGMFYSRGDSAVVSRIEQRIAKLCNWPVENGEGMQILNYAPGAEYKPHMDYFNPESSGSLPMLRMGGQRLATIVMYLNTPELGGGTSFPDVGLEVCAKKGSAVFFSYDAPHESTLTKHGGMPVIKGEKWAATKWLRESEFKLRS